VSEPWLSLPDEDPPERGLAELMAAARAKAEVMASPPWWKRVFDVLRRPPVLALATVVVLLGGVIVVGHHRGGMQDARPAPPAPAFVPAAASGSAAVEPAPQAPVQAAEPLPPPPAPMKHEHHKAPAPHKESVETTKLQVAEPPLSEQLGRCRAAANHKDCAGARACAKQLEQRDRSYFDANAANDATLRSCL
jgi:hypothetical protein